MTPDEILALRSKDAIRAFLMARLAEDDRNINDCQNWTECGPSNWEETDEGTYGCRAHPSLDRATTDNGSKRRIVEWADTDLYVLELLALPYCSHPDYDADWLL